MQIILFQKFVHNTRLWCFYMHPLFSYTFMLTELMLNKFTYTISILLTVATRTTTEIQYFVSSKQIENGSVQTNYAMLNLIDNF